MVEFVFPLDRVVAYRVGPHAFPLRPASQTRAWMLKSEMRFSNRCLPLRTANGIGWFVLNPKEVTVEWDGNALHSSEPEHAKLHFGERVITFEQGHLFRTDPGWGIWVKGPPNIENGPLQNLEAIVETDHLPYPFTINLRFAAPGRVRLRKGAVLAQLIPYPLSSVANVELTVSDLSSEPLLGEHQQRWIDERARMKGKKAPWHGWYSRGVDCPFPHQKIVQNGINDGADLNIDADASD